MRQFEPHPEVVGDLLEIWDFIALDDSEAADRMLEELARRWRS